MITTVVHIVDPDPIQAHKKNNDNLNYYHFNPLTLLLCGTESRREKIRAVNPHSFFAVPDPAVLLNADPNQPNKISFSFFCFFLKMSSAGSGSAY